MKKGDYYNTTDSVQEYINSSKDVNGEELIEKLRQFIPHDSYLLEIGSGPGSDWNILNKNYNVIGSDNSIEFLNHLHKSNPTGEFLELDATTLQTDKKFDAIYSNKVLHHLTDEDLAVSIKRQSELLSLKGIVCHSFWKGEGSEIFKGLFVNYHSLVGIRTYFEEFFELLLLEEYMEFEKDDSILIIGQKTS